MLSRVLKAMPLGLLVGVLGVGMTFFHFSHDFEEDTGLGLLFKLRGQKKAPSQAVVVSIDKESADQLKISENPDRWPRSLHARLIEILIRAGASVITFDVHFMEPRVPEDDKGLAREIAKAGNVVLGDALSSREIPFANTAGSTVAEHRIVKFLKPLPLLGDAAVASAPFVLPRIPFKVNQFWTFQTGARRLKGRC